MGHEHGRHADLVVEAAEPLPQFDAHLRIEGPERLVEEEDPRADRQRPGEGHSLALAAGELRGLPRTEVVEAHQMEQLVDPGLDLGLRGFPHPHPEGDVLEHAHVAEEGIVLEHEAHVPLSGVAVGDVGAILFDPAGVGPLEPGNDPQERRLARARRPEERQERPLGDVERDVVERLEGAE